MKTPWWFMYKTPLAIMLLPVSFIYSISSRIVQKMRARTAYKSRRPIICVGNIMAGGVGKTPIVRALAKYLNAPVVMRGYKKSAATGNAGDEALMLSRSGIQVHTGNRIANLKILNNDANGDAPIIMDDGFQNTSIIKDISILVFDSGIGVGNGFVLPAGPLRQGTRAIKHADAVIIIRNQNMGMKKIKIPANIPVFYADNKTISPYDENQKLVAFAGIGYPKKFFKSLKNVVATRAFADHYDYAADDIKKLCELAMVNGAKLITTEKDWVRLPENVKSEIQYAKLETVIEPAFLEWIKGKVENGDVKTES